jgi:hypothetical protein
MNKALWTTQGLLSALFLFGGATKLVMPLEELAAQTGLPGPFMLFIGLAEVAGALGLILPGLFRIRTGLTPLAAAGLVIIMIGATVMVTASDGALVAAIPGVTGLLAAFVAYGRSRVAPYRRRSSHPARRAIRRIARQAVPQPSYRTAA